MGPLPAKTSRRKEASPPRVTMLALAAVAVGMAVGTVLTVESRATDHMLRFYLLGAVLPGLLLLVAGTIVWMRQPQNPLGPLLLLDSIAQTLWGLTFAPIPAIVTVGLLLQDINVAVTVHVTLAWPSGRLKPGADRATVVIFYVGAILARGLTSGTDPTVEGDLLYPSPLLAVQDEIALVVNLVILPFFLLWTVRVVQRWRKTSGASRRLMRPVVISAPVFALLYTVGYPVWNLELLPPRWTSLFVDEVVWLVAYGALPVAFLVGALQLRLARVAVVSALMEGGELPTPDRLETLLRRRLADPQLQVLRYSAAVDGFVDREGRRHPLPPGDPLLAATTLERNGQPIAAVVHDAALLHDPGLVGTLTKAIRLTLDTTALREQLHARGGEVEGLPDGDVTFLFGDVQGSTALLERLPDRYPDLLRELRSMVTDTVAVRQGRVVDARGDEFFAVFGDAPAAIMAAVDLQRRLAAASWPAGVDVRVRMGLHRGRPRLSGDGYVGMDVHVAARVMAAAHGGQVLLSDSSVSEVPGVTLRPLGAFQLAGIRWPVTLLQVEAPGLPIAFPPPRAQPCVNDTPVPLDGPP